MKKSPPQPAPLDVNELIREVLLVLHASLVSDRIEVRLDLSEEVPVILGDRVQLQQVILNLVMNAAEAMRDNSDNPRTLLVSSHVLETGEVAISVRDSGVGVDPTVFEKLFEPFFTTKPRGMGMGLFVSRSIVERHRGHLWALTSEGQGATFHVTLPAVA
jgi:signal transduction histidine kinase